MNFEVVGMTIVVLLACIWIAVVIAPFVCNLIPVVRDCVVDKGWDCIEKQRKFIELKINHINLIWKTKSGESNMDKDNHCIKLNFNGKFVSVYIDENRINAESLYLLNDKGERVTGETIIEIQGAELKITNIRDLAIVMNENTFERFCELWRKIHVENAKQQ